MGPAQHGRDMQHVDAALPDGLYHHKTGIFFISAVDLPRA